MPRRIQDYLAAATEQAAIDLVAAFERLPADKRSFKPVDTSRSATDQVAECALLNGYVADLLATGAWPLSGYDVFVRDKAEAAALDWETLRARLEENTRRAVGAIRAVPDDALSDAMVTVWKTRTVADVIGHALWNMTYHEGQINYLASLLGCPS